MNIRSLKYILLAVLTSCFCLLQAQTANNNTALKYFDGVYSSYNDFKINRPGFKLYEIPNFSYKMDGANNLLFLKDSCMSQLEKSPIQSLDNIWGLCIKGEPFIKIKHPQKDSAIYFVKLYLIGSISYFYYPSIIDKEVEMQVYSPFTGNMVATKTIVNKERTLIKKMLRFSTGEVADYNSANFKKWIQDDERLLKTIEDLTEEEQEEKLFKTLKIYNDRHPISK